MFNNLLSSSDAWVQMDGLATDVAASTRGDIFVAGTKRCEGGYIVYEWNQQWVEIGAGLRVAAAPDGTPWVVDNVGMRIQRRVGGRWITIQGEAQDIGVGADGTPWVIGPDAKEGGYGVHRFVSPEKGWERIDGCAGVRIAVDSTGKAWVVNSNRDVFAYNGSTFDHQGSGVLDVSAGPNGSIALACIDGSVRIRRPGAGSGWTQVRPPFGFVNIAVMSQGQILGADQSTRIYCEGVGSNAEAVQAANALAGGNPAPFGFAN
ncbi:hypothetical protein VARIO8X_120005 [Burkholderiales bacterium 8X]|nr:hypothetical protein VARIO8X_120005 [Burkholderiales bacterium 8X]